MKRITQFRDSAENLGRDLIVRKWIRKMRRAVDHADRETKRVVPFPGGDKPKEAA